MFTFATEQDISDIKKITSKEILLNAAVMAEKGKCLPSDILCQDGVWSAFNKEDVNKRAMMILHDARNKK